MTTGGIPQPARVYLGQLQDVDTAGAVLNDVLTFDGAEWVPAAAGAAGAPANAAYVTLALDATLTDERVLTAGDALDLSDGGAGGLATLDVLYDGVSIGLNGSNELEVIGGALTDAVIKAPGSSVRNLITATGDFVELPILGAAGQTEAFLAITEDGDADAFLRAVPGRALGLGAGSFDPAAYGGYMTRWVNSAGGTFYDPGGAPPIDPGAAGQALMDFVDVAVEPSVDNNGSHYARSNSMRLNGANDVHALYASYYELFVNGTKAAGTGDQAALAIAFAASPETTNASTCDVGQLVGGQYGVTHRGNGNITIGAFGTIVQAYTTNAGRPTVPWLVGGYFEARTFNNRGVTLAEGIRVQPVGQGTNVAQARAIYIENQMGQASQPVLTYALYSAGGESRLHAGAAATIPLVVKGAAAQTANLQEWRSSADAVLAAVDDDGSVSVGSSLRAAAAGYLELTEIAAPAAPAANALRLFARDDGAGLTQLCVEFASGNIVVIAEDWT
jgi:hypothetical protein